MKPHQIFDPARRRLTASVRAIEPPDPRPLLSEEDPLVEEPKPKRVCIVSPDVWGPVRNGGVGTLFRNLAFTLTEAGHEVTLLYTFIGHCEDGTIEDWERWYAERGIEFVALPDPGTRVGPAVVSQQGRTSMLVLEWLRARGRPFDVVHAPEYGGALFFSLWAKKSGLALTTTTFVIGTHGSLWWNAEGNFAVIDNLRELIRSQMELVCVELADVVVSSSQHMVHWLQSHDVDLPERTYVWPNAVDRDESVEADEPRVPIEGIAFFGRLEPRKGIHLFLEALAQLPEGALDGVPVYFMGKRSHRFDLDAGIAALLERRPDLAAPTVETELNSAEALAMLKDKKLLACVPSLLDNSPLVITECIAQRIPMVTSDVGGDRELLREDCHADVLVAPTPHDLAAGIGRALHEGAALPKPSRSSEEINGVWASWHGGLRRVPRHQPENMGSVADLTVCVVHHDRPDTLPAALESLADQTVLPAAIVLVDNGSRSDEAKAMIRRLAAAGQVGGVPLTVLEGPNVYPGAARNRAAAIVSTEFLLFADDDNVAKPNMIESFVRAAKTSPDIASFTCFADHFSARSPHDEGAVEHRALAAGGLGQLAVLENFQGDTNAIVRKAAFDEVGGFHEAWGVGREDHDLFVRLSQLTGGVGVVPEALFFYRVSDTRIRQRHFAQGAGPSLVAMSGASHLPRDVRITTEGGLGMLMRLQRVEPRLGDSNRGLEAEREAHEKTRSDLRWLLRRLDGTPAKYLLRRFGGYRTLFERYVTND